MNIINIGYGSQSVFHSLRHDLFFDKLSNIAYFSTGLKKYSIRLNDECLNAIKNHKKIWVTLNYDKTKNKTTVSYEIFEFNTL